MSIKVTLNGKPFNSNDLVRLMERKAVDIAKREIPKIVAEKFRDSQTGEAPKVLIEGESIESLRDLDGKQLRLDGSPDLIQNLKEKLGVESSDSEFAKEK